MRPLSYAGYRFPPEIIQHAIWLYLRFTLSFRDVEELLAERGIDVSYETIRRWVAVFGPVIARRLRAMRPKPHTTWHLDEMFVSIGGKRMYQWRDVDAEGEAIGKKVASHTRGLSHSSHCRRNLAALDERMTNHQGSARQRGRAARIQTRPWKSNYNFNDGTRRQKVR